jgi:hypothetical protein
MASDFLNPGVLTTGAAIIKSSNVSGIVICGLPRSGTTAFASGFKNAGFNLGQGLGSVLEDVAFRKSLETRSQEEVLKYAKRRELEAEDLPWCVKFPDAYKYIPLIHSADPSIVFVVATRDPFCVALRNNISMFDDFQAAFRKSVDDYTFLHNQLRASLGAGSVVIASYEKLLTSPRPVFSSILASIMPDSSQATITEMAAKASSGIVLDPADYLAESNIRPVHHVVLGNDLASVHGWCFFRANPRRKAEIEVYYNRSLLASAVCDQPRPESSKGIPELNCHFEILLDSDLVKNADDLQIMLKGTQYSLPIVNA